MEKLLKLNDWFGVNEEWLKTERPTYPEAAKKAAADLGFPITKANITAVNEAKGGVWKVKSSRPSGSFGVKARITELETTVVKLLEDNQKLHAALSSLRGLAHELYWQLGANPPVGYTLPPDPNRVRNSTVVNKR
jgi:hypothetical protein